MISKISSDLTCSQTCFSRLAIATYPRSVCPQTHQILSMLMHSRSNELLLSTTRYNQILSMLMHNRYNQILSMLIHQILSMLMHNRSNMLMLTQLVPCDQLLPNQLLPGDQPRLLVPSPLPVVLAQATEAKIHKTSDAKIHKKKHAKIHKITKIL
jgi:hypothetical protein